MKNAYTLQTRSGFTLVELLITISIIAILAAIGIVTYSVALKSGRDAKRQSDLRAIQSALEQYHNDQGFYPTPLNLSTGAAFTNCSGNPVSPCTVTKTYMNTTPTEPLTSPPYLFNAQPSSCDNVGTKCTSYCLYAKLENSPLGLPSACTNTTYNSAVTPP